MIKQLHITKSHAQYKRLTCLNVRITNSGSRKQVSPGGSHGDRDSKQKRGSSRSTQTYGFRNSRASIEQLWSRFCFTRSTGTLFACTIHRRRWMCRRTRARLLPRCLRVYHTTEPSLLREPTSDNTGYDAGLLVDGVVSGGQQFEVDWIKNGTRGQNASSTKRKIFCQRLAKFCKRDTTDDATRPDNNVHIFVSVYFRFILFTNTFHVTRDISFKQFVLISWLEKRKKIICIIKIILAQ